MFISNTVIFANEYYICTYNIRCDEAKDKQSKNNWSIRVENLSNLILFNSFDIFGVQELNSNRLKDLINFIGIEYNYVGVASDDGQDTGSYSAIFYKKNKFKILASDTFWLSENPNKVSKGWDSKFNRICTWAQLYDINNKCSLWFFNTHLDATGEIAKRKGLELISQKITEITKNKNTILTGDFNLYESDKTYKTIINSKQLLDAYDISKYRWMPTGSYNAFNPERISSKNLDHILVSKNIKVSRYGILNNFYYNIDGVSISNYKKIPKGAKNIELHIPSDHYPLCCWVDVN